MQSSCHRYPSLSRCWQCIKELQTGGLAACSLVKKKKKKGSTFFWTDFQPKTKLKQLQNCLCKDACCVSIQGLHPSEEHLKANYITWRLSQSEGSSKCVPQMLLLFPHFGGCTATILHGLTYPKIPLRTRKINKGGDMVWHISSLSRAWAAELVT